jgi:hypothetical protein
MKIILLLLFIHFFAYSVVKAEENVVPSAVSPAILVDAPAAMPPTQLNVKQASSSGSDSVSGASELQNNDCQNLLPQMEADYKDLEQRYRDLNHGSLTSQESYMVSFNQMTQILFQMVKTKEEETLMLSQSRDRLRQSVGLYVEQGSSEASKKLQGDYLDLTVRLYSTLMDAQKSLETLKEQLAQVESNRGQLENGRQELEALDHQKLALEGRLISLKIKCQDGRHR